MTVHPLSYYHSAPPLRTATEDHATLLCAYWVTGICIIAVIFRVTGRYIRIEKLHFDDTWMAITVIPLVWRLGFIHSVLKHGTHNADPIALAQLTPEQLSKRGWSSGMVLGARVGLVTYIWAQKFAVTTFYARIVSTLLATRRFRLGLLYLRLILLSTYLLSLLMIFIPCAPSSYTRVLPPPSATCRTAFLPVITSAALSSICDVLLTLAPIPTIIQITMKWHRKLRLYISFGLSLGTAALSAYKAYAIVVTHGAQQTRSVWASLEILCATFVANAIVLNSFVSGKGEQKPRYRHPDPDERDRIREIRREERERAMKTAGMAWIDDEELEDWSSKCSRPGTGGQTGVGGLGKYGGMGSREVVMGSMPRTDRPASGESRWEMLGAVGSTGETDAPGRGGNRESLSSTTTAHHHAGSGGRGEEKFSEEKEQRPMSALSVEGGGSVTPPQPAVLRDVGGLLDTAKR